MLVSNPPQTCVLLAQKTHRQQTGFRRKGRGCGAPGCLLWRFPRNLGSHHQLSEALTPSDRGRRRWGVGYRARASVSSAHLPLLCPRALSALGDPERCRGLSLQPSLTAATAGRGASPPVTTPPPLPIQASPGPHLPFPPPPAPAWLPSALPTLPSWTKVTSAAYLPIWPSSSVRLGRKPQEGRACGTSTAHLA